IISSRPPAAPPKKETPPSPQTSVQYYQEPKHATLLVWIGVSVVALFIGVLWVWNARLVVSDALSRGFSEEGQILGSAKTNFDAAIEDLSASLTSTVAIANQTPTTTPSSTEQNIKNVLQVILSH